MVTVADEADGTSSVGDFERAGLLPSPAGSAAPGGGGLPIPADASVKVTDLFWSPCAVGQHVHEVKGQRVTLEQIIKGEWRQGWDRRGEAGAGRGVCKTDMQSALLGEVADKKGAGRCRVERKG